MAISLTVTITVMWIFTIFLENISKITWLICVLITKREVNLSRLEVDNISTIFHNYLSMDSYKPFFFGPRNERSNVGFTCNKEYSPNYFPRLIKGIISPMFKELHINRLNYHLKAKNITLPFWYYQCCTCSLYSQLSEEICIQSTLETLTRKPLLHWQSCWILSSYWNC